ncbi:MAG: DUF2608 domain-containing protein [Holosporaceae bacterium]|nr:MAG: DUF2608 domain-containing protein [Holosporaceae bacterium]
MQELKTALNQHQKETAWVIFDIFHTIADFTPPATHAKNKRTYKPWLKPLLKKLTHKQMQYAISNYSKESSNLILIDKDFPSLIGQFQDIGIPVWALTTAVVSMDMWQNQKGNWLVEGLKKIHISFTKTAPHLKESEMHSEKKPKHPAFYIDGILFTNGELGLKKGEALILALKGCSKKPKKIIMVDDKEKNLLSMEKELHRYDASIDFTGIIYTVTHTPLMEEGAFKKILARTYRGRKKI